MRPLKSHFPDHALSTLDTVLKQTKEARVFRRAQAVHAVVAGQHVSPSPPPSIWRILPCANGYSVLPRKGSGVAGSPASTVDRPKSRARWNGIVKLTQKVHVCAVKREL